MKRHHLCALLLLASCHKAEVAPPPKTESKTWDVSDSYNSDEAPKEGGAVKAKGLYEGKLDNDALKETFDAKSQEVLACFQLGKKKNKYLEGDIRLSFELTSEGKPQKLFIATSNLGDDAVEVCFIELINTTALPKPIGGTVLAGYTFGYHPASKPGGSGEPKEDEREKYLTSAKTALKSCKKLSDEFQAVVWIQPEGKATSVGYSAEVETKQEERECVIEALLAAKYPKSYRKATYLSFNIQELPK